MLIVIRTYARPPIAATHHEISIARITHAAMMPHGTKLRRVFIIHGRPYGQSASVYRTVHQRVPDSPPACTGQSTSVYRTYHRLVSHITSVCIGYTSTMYRTHHQRVPDIQTACIGHKICLCRVERQQLILPRRSLSQYSAIIFSWSRKLIGAHFIFSLLKILSNLAHCFSIPTAG